MAFRYVYLMSAPHSGSTLVCFLLGSHPDVSTVGEFGTDFPAHKGRCSCGEVYARCPFWLRWKSLAEERGLAFEIGSLGAHVGLGPGNGFREDLYLHLFPSAALNRLRDLVFLLDARMRRKAARAADRAYALAKILCEDEGTRVFLDTTKNPLFARFLAARARRNGAEFRAIALVRDGRAVTASLLEKEPGYYPDPESAIRGWVWSNRNMERVVAAYGLAERTFRLRHEDLCNEPEPLIRRMFAFMGVDADAPVDFRNGKPRHVVGNYMRHTFDGTVRKPSDAWRKKLDTRVLERFRRLAGSMNRSYGYGDA